MAARDFVGELRTCPICGKEFNVMDFDAWVYKRTLNHGTGPATKSRNYIFCSWKCLREYDKQHEKDRKKQYRLYAWDK